MQQNRISMVVTQQEEETVMAGLDQIETTLKGLITLGAEDRRKIRMMGPKRADFARAVIRTLQQNPQLAPSGLDVAGAQADLDALDRMQRIDDRVQRLATLTKDSRDALGSDIMAVADAGYKLSKSFGPALGLMDKVRELSSLFTRSRKKTPTPDSET